MTERKHAREMTAPEMTLEKRLNEADTYCSEVAARLLSDDPKGQGVLL